MINQLEIRIRFVIINHLLILSNCLLECLYLFYINWFNEFMLDIRAWLNCLALFTFPSSLAFVLLRAAPSGDCQRQCSMRAAGANTCVNYSQPRNPLTTISVICLERASGG